MKGVYIIMSNIADKFEELGVIPVVVLNDAKDALPLAKALVEGGLPCAEVTFRTAAAEESIRLMHEAYPDMVLAAGTVLTTEQVDRAVAAGASVIVSPGFDPEIVDYCINHNRNYKNTAAKFDVSYSQVYSWVKKYDTDGADGLTDRRGHHKTDAEVDELERLRRENLRLKRQLEEKDMVVELLKKVKEFEGM